MRRLIYALAIVITFIITSCDGKSQKDEAIVVIIEDATITDSDNTEPRDTSRKIHDDIKPDTTSSKHQPVKREMSITGAVSLLKLDLERKDVSRLTRHTESLIQSVDKQLEKPLSSELKRALNLFSLKLSSFKRELAFLKDKEDIPSTKIGLLTEKLEELEEVAKRVENRK
jgi:hypothetical protein